MLFHETKHRRGDSNERYHACIMEKWKHISQNFRRKLLLGKSSGYRHVCGLSVILTFPGHLLY